MLVLFLLFSTLANAKEVAFGAPGIHFPWATSQKQGVGTALNQKSKVWFTIARGIVTEVFYPRVDIPQTRDSQFLITDGKSFLHQEQYDTDHVVDRLPGAPLFRIRNTDRWKRYEITKEIWADPSSDVLVQKVRIERFADGLQFFFLHKPAAANSIFGDSAYAPEFVAGEEHRRFGAWHAISSDLAFSRGSVGYVGKSDGFTDLKDFKFDHAFLSAPAGNVALTAELAIPPTKGVTEFMLYLAFGSNRGEAVVNAKAATAIAVDKSRDQYWNEWRNYLAGLTMPKISHKTAKRWDLAESSVLVLKVSEDKTHPGAIVASPSHPWGETTVEDGTQVAERNGGYHVVWPRDLYHAANALMAVGDYATVKNVLIRLRAAQFKADAGFWNFPPRVHPKKGSFPQNFWADGTVLWGGYQADETAMPLLLAYRAWKRGIVELEEVWPLVHDAAVFLSAVGPWTQTERWEEVYGISPNSAGYVIAALAVASEMAHAKGEGALGAKFLELADQWAMKPGDNLDTWTFTTKGKIGDGRYYLRIDGASCEKEKGGAPIWDAWWNPNVDGWMSIGSLSGDDRFKLESEVVDSSFLALARIGVRSASHPLIRETLPEIDHSLRHSTPGGFGYLRYRFDGYGEDKRGRLWPLLTGERLHYELQWRKENGLGIGIIEASLKGYEAFANEQGILPEQVWEKGPGVGKATGSASPLAWTHAEYLQLLRSVEDGAIFEEIPFVRARYGFQ